MNRMIKVLVVSVLMTFLFPMVVAANNDYRLGFGDVLNVTFWADGYEEGLQQSELPVRPDGKVSLAFAITQLDNYRLGPGDTININVWGFAELSSTGLVRSDGKVAFPMIGEIWVDGMTPAELTKTLTEALKTYIKEPVVTVNVVKPRRIPVMEVVQADGLTADELTQKIKEVLSKHMTNPQVTLTFSKYRTVRVYVLGEAVTPGTYEISKSHRLLDAIGAAGGYTKFTKRNEIYIVHRDGRYVKVDLDRILKKGDLSQNYELSEGDAVYLTKNGLSFLNDILPYITGIYQTKEILK